MYKPIVYLNNVTNRGNAYDMSRRDFQENSDNDVLCLTNGFYAEGKNY